MTTKKELHDTLALVANGLANGNRLALLERLAQAEASVETLASLADLTVGNASQHLQQLRKAGLVTARRDGKQMFYRLTDERIIILINLLRQVAETNLAEMERLLARLFSDDDSNDVMKPVSRSELQAGLESGHMAVLDVRPESEYAAGHLSGAINIPLDQLDNLLSLLPRDKEIVAYCRGPYCVLSHEAAKRLRTLGYQVRRFEEGFPEWKAAGLPMQHGEVRV
ncbi:MAG: metalloregulator ArsR/SmtB family transcription factor [Gammaproteobacteria bacterium]|nr:metalloregulator ArsR/SmtB family transcription factor [Gammaproteobacteria bacterium]MDP2348850.1 metalloregulator ArsR/SmtB family transcription factor [Gammaproteobacteria bacterium]